MLKTRNNTLPGRNNPGTIPEEQGKGAGSIALNAIDWHLEEGLTEVDDERTHRVRKRK